MRFLIDQPVSHIVAEGLCTAGHDAVHVRQYGMGAADDPDIFDRAVREGRTVISVDTDFGTLLAMRKAREPSVILFRKEATERPGEQLVLLLKNIPTLKDALERGSIIVFDGYRIRVRQLPIFE